MQSRDVGNHESPQASRSAVLFGDYASDWLGVRVDLAERTLELYRWLLKRHVGPTFNDRPLTSITPPDVRLWHASLATIHATTAAKAYRLLSSIMKTAVSDELVARNPCQVRGAATEHAPERPIASMAEVDALTAAMPANLRVAVLLAAWCQLRRGEVRGLRRCDVDVEKGTLTVSVTRTVSMSGRTIIKEPKTRAGRRTVAIPPHTLGQLIVHLESHVGEDPDSLLVPASNRALSAAWSSARTAIRREDLRFHDLRRSGLTWSEATGASIAELMRRAGHASQAAAIRYQHATDDRDRVLAQALATLAGHCDREQVGP